MLLVCHYMFLGVTETLLCFAFGEFEQIIGLCVTIAGTAAVGVTIVTHHTP